MGELTCTTHHPTFRCAELRRGARNESGADGPDFGPELEEVTVFGEEVVGTSCIAPPKKGRELWVRCL